MKPTPLTSLAKIPISIVSSNKLVAPFRPRAGFKLPIVVQMTGPGTVQWSKENALNLSYRWFDDKGGCVDREGRRTALSVDHLVSGDRVEVDVAGSTPDEPGVFQLTVSLVLEGVEWACDVTQSGWMEKTVPVTMGPAWPTELRSSAGGRALRGALVAAEIARTVVAERESEAAGRERAAEDDDGRRALVKAVPLRAVSVTAKMKSRLRRAIGIDEIHDQLETLLSSAHRQERNAAALEAEVQALKDQLEREPANPALAIPSFEQQMIDASGRLKKLSQRTGAAQSGSEARSSKPGSVSAKIIR
jgi:hypothetical protein